MSIDSSIMRTKLSLPSLPEEMIDLVISYADHQTQQQLRLCCKQFNRLTTPRYFRTFRFRFSQLSLDGLISIANHSSIAKHVQDLEFNSHQLLWFYNLDHFQKILWLQPGQPWSPPPGLKHLSSHQSFTRQELHQIYTAYISERDTPSHYIDCLLSRADPSNPLLHRIYPNLPRALASLSHLHSITATFGMPHQQPPPAHYHTWRGLTFAKPDPDPPGDRDHQKALDLSCLLHALGHAATTLNAPPPRHLQASSSPSAATRAATTTTLIPTHPPPLSLRTLTIPTIGPSIFGASALESLWNLDAPSPALPDTVEEDIEQEEYLNALYARQFRTITSVVAGLTRLDLRLNWSRAAVGDLVGPLAYVLKQARELEELALVVEQREVGMGPWRGWLTPEEGVWRGKDVLLALLSDWTEWGMEVSRWGRRAEGEGEEEEEEEEKGDGEGEEGVQWPCLRKLTLSVATTQDGLLGLLGRIAGSLRSLKLDGVRFMPRLGDWQGALREMRGMLELEELEMSWLMHDMASAANGCDAMLVSRTAEGYLVEDEMAERQYRRIYRHYEMQVVDYVLRKGDSEPELDQDAFFKSHSGYCERCEGMPLECSK